MPLDTVTNDVGEYYSAHYLDSTFAKDIAELKRRWRELGSSPLFSSSFSSASPADAQHAGPRR